jgi:hypothetical protein
VPVSPSVAAGIIGSNYEIEIGKQNTTRVLTKREIFKNEWEIL